MSKAVNLFSLKEETSVSIYTNKGYSLDDSNSYSPLTRCNSPYLEGSACSMLI